MADFMHTASAERANDLDLFYERCADMNPSFLLLRISLFRVSLSEIKQVVERMGKVVIDIGDGLTLLHQAAQFDRFDIARYLVKEKGHPLEVKTVHGETPLDQAAWRGCVDVAIFLIRSGADVDCQTNLLYSPLHRCAFYGHEHLAALFCLAGANQKIRDSNGQTAYEVAVERKNRRLITLLKPEFDADGNDITGMDLADTNPKHPQYRPERREALLRLYRTEVMTAPTDTGDDSGDDDCDDDGDGEDDEDEDSDEDSDEEDDEEDDDGSEGDDDSDDQDSDVDHGERDVVTEEFEVVADPAIEAAERAAGL